MVLLAPRSKSHQGATDLFPGLPALLAPEHGQEVRGLAGGRVVPNTFFTGLFLVAPASTIRLGTSIPRARGSVGYCRVPSPSAAQHPSSTWGFGSFF